MSKTKPSIPKGTRDFGPDVMVRRNYIIKTIREVFEKYGYLPLETASVENLSVLMGKYGDEGDKLIFKILNSGDFLSKTDAKDLKAGAKELTPKIAEKGLRYDLTVPLARYIVMNQNEIAFPFKRYQIQPVWRADRPQRGRYREFFQCDADVIGSKSLINEAEIIMMTNEVLRLLKIKDYTIKFNNRKILAGMTEAIGMNGRESDLCTAIDKLDKIGIDKVQDELKEKGFTAKSIEKLSPSLNFKGTNQEVIKNTLRLIQDSETGIEGILEIRETLKYLRQLKGRANKVEFDPTLARGLSYYTGGIFEVKVNNVKIGSISGGGRYDNLTGTFGLEGMTGVGFSFGIDRIYDVMEELDLFQKTAKPTTKALLVNLGDDNQAYTLGILSYLRKEKVNCEIYADSGKLKKQMAYANKKKIPYVILIGSDEVATGRLTLKNMTTGKQRRLFIQKIVSIISK